jgi:hypothetical protein
MNTRWSRCSRRARLLLAASSALLLTGCAANKLATFSAGDARLSVKLPAFCDAFLQPVPVPVVTAKTDARGAYVRTADALDGANDRLTVAGLCAGDQRQDYAGKGVR